MEVTFSSAVACLGVCELTFGTTDMTPNSGSNEKLAEVTAKVMNNFCPVRDRHCCPA